MSLVLCLILFGLSSSTVVPLTPELPYRGLHGVATDPFAVSSPVVAT